ncbi:hypothetical protein AMTR_s00041p00226380 [Amborella trichopoda]|uniref:Uncharacterized protein n=1 Tax=Amborella trichopoda TaxID=13333 RepID=W1PU11_AMBTC|nr:hypothetical protein AMTR_s00041p00226380 [Amborella trichopoda]
MGHGVSTPHFRHMAMKILNLTSNTSGCAYKEDEQTKAKRLNNLVFVQSNQKLQERHRKLERNEREAIEAVDIHDTCEWLIDADDDEVFPGEGLNWGQVHETVGTAMPLVRTTRAQSQSQRKAKEKAHHGKAMAKKKKRVMTSREDDKEEEVDSEETRDDTQYVEEGDDSYDNGMASSSNAPLDPLKHPMW